MDNKHIITTAQPEDLPRILEIFEQSIRADYNVADELIQKCLDHLADAFHNRQYEFSFWVAKNSESGKVIGWLSYLPIFDSILKKDTALEASIYLDSAYRQNGLGADFFGHTLFEIKQYDFSFVYGFVNKHNRNGAKLFTKLGALEIGKIPAVQNGFPYFSEKTIYVYKLK